MGTGSLTSHDRRAVNILRIIEWVKKNLSVEEQQSDGLVFNAAVNYAVADVNVSPAVARDYARQVLYLLKRGPKQISVFGEKQDAYATKPQQKQIQNIRNFIEQHREPDVIPVEQEKSLSANEILEKNLPARKETYEKEHKSLEVDSEIQVEA